jgi:soluble lytic murein transglycosylase
MHAGPVAFWAHARELGYTRRVLRRAAIVLCSIALGAWFLGSGPGQPAADTSPVQAAAVARAGAPARSSSSTAKSTATSTSAGGAADTPARRLGEAWRAFEGQAFERAHELARGIDRGRLINDDYALYVMAQSAFFLGRHEEALAHFRDLAGTSGSRFRDLARWRVADCLWHLGDLRAASAAYARLVDQAEEQRQPDGDLGLARYRMAEILARKGKKPKAIGALREFLRRHPEHPLAEAATRRLRALGGERAARLTAADRIARAQVLTAERLWNSSYAELAAIDDAITPELRRERDFWTAMTLFKMRRRYEDAGRILTSIYDDLGSRAAMALFHGARALSRADRDQEAIQWYQRLVAEFPRTPWAAEAQFLSGWLSFNLGAYQVAIPHLEATVARYGRSEWGEQARWFLGFSHFLLGQHERALPHFAILARQRDRLAGGQGRYWHARALQELGRTDEAAAGYRALIAEYPFSWYALLARSRLQAQGITVDPFGRPPVQQSAAAKPAAGKAGAGRGPGQPEGPKVPELAELDAAVDPALAADPVIRAADELLAAELPIEAGVELRRGEHELLARHPRPRAMAVLLDRYRRAGNYNRPWMLAVVHGGDRALDVEPAGRARLWWEHAYPLAYRPLVEQWRHVGDSPPYYLYAIMRKESGFDPHIVSYADARGLLQMIPPTTRRVARVLGIPYTEDMLYDPELNIRLGSWYIGRLYHKFKGQVPLAAGSYNSGPRPVMRWVSQHGHRPIDELVELVSYTQTRGYMKKVTEVYARYLYLYEGSVYEQPLAVDAAYVKDELTY